MKKEGLSSILPLLLSNQDETQPNPPNLLLSKLKPRLIENPKLSPSFSLKIQARLKLDWLNPFLPFPPQALGLSLSVPLVVCLLFLRLEMKGKLARRLGQKVLKD